MRRTIDRRYGLVGALWARSADAFNEDHALGHITAAPGQVS